jgi:hypothetical protein
MLIRLAILAVAAAFHGVPSRVFSLVFCEPSSVKTVPIEASTHVLRLGRHYDRDVLVSDRIAITEPIVAASMSAGILSVEIDDRSQPLPFPRLV